MSDRFFTLTDGREVAVNENIPGRFDPPGPITVTYQFASSVTSLIGSPIVIDEDHPLNAAVSPVGYTIFSQLDAVTMTGGGFEVAYDIHTTDNEGIEHYVLKGIGVGADGQTTTNLNLQLDSSTLPVSNAFPSPPTLAELPGDRFVVSFQTFDAENDRTAHVDLATSAGGVYADLVVDSTPSAITHAAGDLTLTWNNTGVAIREVFDLNGNLLQDRGVSNVVTLSTASNTNLELLGYNPAHDELRLLNVDGSVAGGAASTLTFDARDHSLTWDPDSEGPAAAVQIANSVDLDSASPNGQPFSVANLAENFRPAVLKIIEAGGSQDITWFDTTNSQPWDTLHATEDAQGNVLTYGSTLDDGTQQVFHFDVGNQQPWTRYVDQIDVSGHVTERTVLYDDNTSWTAKYAYSAGQVVSYELDTFDAQGRQVGQSFFNADGTPLVGH